VGGSKWKFCCSFLCFWIRFKNKYNNAKKKGNKTNTAGEKGVLRQRQGGLRDQREKVNRDLPGVWRSNDGRTRSVGVFLSINFWAGDRNGVNMHLFSSGGKESRGQKAKGTYSSRGRRTAQKWMSKTRIGLSWVIGKQT